MNDNSSNTNNNNDNIRSHFGSRHCASNVAARVLRALAATCRSSSRRAAKPAHPRPASTPEGMSAERAGMRAASCTYTCKLCGVDVQNAKSYGFQYCTDLDHYLDYCYAKFLEDANAATTVHLVMMGGNPLGVLEADDAGVITVDMALQKILQFCTTSSYVAILQEGVPLCVAHSQWSEYNEGDFFRRIRADAHDTSATLTVCITNNPITPGCVPPCGPRQPRMKTALKCHRCMTLMKQIAQCIACALE